MEALHLPTRLGVLHGLEVGYIEKAPGQIPVTSFSPAARRPAHATALGKALLAFAPADVLRQARDGVVPGFTARTLTRPDQLHHALHRVRCDGRALDQGELSAHVRDRRGPVLGPGDIALAAVEVEVEDLLADTIATVAPVLTLAAHGLMRELRPCLAAVPAWPARAPAGWRRSRRLTMPARRVPGGFARRSRRSSLAGMFREWSSRSLATVRGGAILRRVHPE